MASEEAMTKSCSGEECDKSFTDTFEGRNQAWAAGWYISKWGGDAYCPDDLPIWVPDHFRKKD